LTSVIAGWWLTLILYNRAVSGVAARGARQRAVARAEVAARAVARAEVAATAMAEVVAREGPAAPGGERGRGPAAAHGAKKGGG